MIKLMQILTISMLTVNCTSGPKIVDLSGDFVSFYDDSKNLPLNERKKMFDRKVGKKFPDFYNYKDKKWSKKRTKKLEHFNTELKTFPALREKYLKTAQSFNNSLANNIKSFKHNFPDFNENISIYLIHSLGEMDGGTRTINNNFYFIFGADGMARYHHFDNQSPFFHHELLHVYQNQFMPENNCKVIWCALWGEGFAVYVSKRLNPSANDGELLLDLPKGMVKSVKKDLKKNFKFLQSKMDSGEDKDYTTFFLISSKNKEIIPRTGYYLGYLVAEEVGKSFSMQKLAKMNQNELEPLVKSAIKKLAK